jgi:hypothetical protein
MRKGDMEQTRSSDHVVSRDIQTSQRVGKGSEEKQPTGMRVQKVGASMI